jgi:hypothetical protein
VSPILVRPVREQLEHDRVIRLLQARWRRRYESAMNVGEEKVSSLRVGTSTVYPDLMLYEPERGKRLEGVVEVETGESVNHLEALAQWTYLGRARVPFFLYVPANMVDVARRLCANHEVSVNEIWSYHTVGDEIRFTLVSRAVVERKPLPRKAEPGRVGSRKIAPKRIVRPASAKSRKGGARKTTTQKGKPARKAAARSSVPATRARAGSSARRKGSGRSAMKRSSRPKARAKGK